MSYLPLSFIQGKIEALQNALFFPISDSLLKMPTCVVHTLRVDDVGQIWFTIPRPTQFIYTFDNAFGAKLDFTKKDKEFYMRVLGKAYIVTDPEEINSISFLTEENQQKIRDNETVLIKVKITHADYFEKKPEGKHQHSILSNIRTVLYKWYYSAKHAQHQNAFRKFPVGGMVHADYVFSN